VPSSQRDRREEILLRIMALLREMLEVGDFVTVWRDRGEVPPVDSETKAPLLPAAILLDGRETPRVRTEGHAYGRAPPGTVMTLLPEVWVVLMPKENVTNEGVGEELSLYRVKLVGKILHDDTLIAIVGANGEIEYRGCETDMQSGGLLEGQMRLDFGLSYVLLPDEL
jgi:hypothetical protein